MSQLLSFLLRAFILAAGLVFAALVAVLFVLVAALWCVAALWGLLTGKPVARFTVRMGPRSAFDAMRRRAPAAGERSRTPRADAAAGVPGRIAADVTDVQARESRS